MRRLVGRIIFCSVRVVYNKTNFGVMLSFKRRYYWPFISHICLFDKKFSIEHLSLKIAWILISFDRFITLSSIDFHIKTQHFDTYICALKYCNLICQDIKTSKLHCQHTDVTRFSFPRWLSMPNLSFHAFPPKCVRVKTAYAKMFHCTYFTSYYILPLYNVSPSLFHSTYCKKTEYTASYAVLV